VRHLIWATATVAAFLLGLELGPLLGKSEVRLTRTEFPRAGEARSTPTEFAPASEARSTRTQFGPDGKPDWYAILQAQDDLARRGDQAGAAALQQRLLDGIRERAGAGDVATARMLLESYVARNPHDPEAYLLDADLQQLQGRGLQALSPLLALLEFADDPEVVTRAREQLALLVEAREAQLASTGDVAGLVRLFEDLSRRDPGFDGHRLRLAHWLLRAGRLADAERILAETGTMGVDPVARDELAAGIELARAGLPFERRHGALHVSVRFAGKPLTLLVDTGATTTAISRAGAIELGARPTGERVRVRTAGGIVESEVHRVSDFEVGALHLEDLSVLVLEGPLPHGVDGLLGMDVLGRFPGVAGTGLPVPAGP
jgi:clan AA aspartic protease (TIGR02281 family)